MSREKNIAIGVDIGGSHICCAAVNLEERGYAAGTFSESKLNNKAGIAEIREIWGGTLQRTIELAGAQAVAGIGFAMPGPFEYDKGIARMTTTNDKYENIYGMNVPDELRSFLRLPDSFPIRFINDATAFALGENWLGEARGSNRSLSITLGTGFGSAFLFNGIPVVEGPMVPENGCLWHLPFEAGIGDDYFSTRGFVKRWKKQSGNTIEGVRELAALALLEPDAKALFDDFGHKLGEFLFPWVQKAGVEVLVIGGNIANAWPLFEPALNAFFARQNYPLRIARSSLGETASIIGSAVLVDEDFYKRVLPLLPKM